MSVYLRTHPLGFLSAASPARVRYVNANSPAPAPAPAAPSGAAFGAKAPFGDVHGMNFPQANQPAAPPNQYQQPAAPPNHQQQPPQAAAARPQQPVPPQAIVPNPPQVNGSNGRRPQAHPFGDEAQVERWFISQTDTELNNNLEGLFAYAQANQNNFTAQETAEMHWLIQKFHDEIQGRMQSAAGWNP